MTATIVLESIDIKNDGDDWPSGKGDFHFLYRLIEGYESGFERRQGASDYTDQDFRDMGFIDLNSKTVDLGSGERYVLNRTIAVDVPFPFEISWAASDLDPELADAGALAVYCWPTTPEHHQSTVADRDGGKMKVVFNWRVTFEPLNWDDFFGRLNGDAYVFVKCLGTTDGPRWLDGLTQTGGIHLASDLPGLSGTLWRCRRLPQDATSGASVVTLQCQGNIEGNRVLDGNTVDGGVYLSPANVSVNERFSGTRWEVLRDVDRNGTNATALRCLGTVPGYEYLDGNTIDGTLRLQNTLDSGFSGARWHFFEANHLLPKTIPA